MIRNFIPFQEAEESQGLWGCEAGKLDGHLVSGVGLEGQPEHPPHHFPQCLQ